MKGVLFARGLVHNITFRCENNSVKLVKLANFLRKNNFSLSKFLDLLEYMKYFGYVDEYDLLDGVDSENIINGLKQLFDMADIKEGEEMGVALSKAHRMTTWPRCGCKDFLMRSGVSKWGIKTLNYYVRGRDRDLSEEVWDKVINKAFLQWSAVADISFVRVLDANSAHLILDVGSGRRDGFDGPGRVLAWAELPQGSDFRGRLLCKFDMSERWVVDLRQQNGILLLNVACHEFGHLLGLDHSRVKTALMAPYYSPAISKPQPNDDIERIQRLYGPPKDNAPQPEPDEPSEPEPEPMPTKPNETIIRIFGSIKDIDIPGYRIFKM